VLPQQGGRLVLHFRNDCHLFINRILLLLQSQPDELQMCFFA